MWMYPTKITWITLDVILEIEAEKVNAMELQMKYQLEEVRKKTIILEKMENLQALKERKAAGKYTQACSDPSQTPVAVMVPYFQTDSCVIHISEQTLVHQIVTDVHSRNWTTF